MQIFLEVIFAIVVLYEPNCTYEVESNPKLLRNDFIIKDGLI